MAKKVGEHLQPACKSSHIFYFQVAAGFKAGLTQEQLGHPCIYFYNISNDEFDLAGGCLVSSEVAEKLPDTAEQKKTPVTGEFYKYTHVGSYEKLPEVWAKLMDKAKTDGRKTNFGFEIYIGDPQSIKESELITEVYLKVE